MNFRLPEKEMMGIHDCVLAAEDGDCSVEKTFVSNGEMLIPHMYSSVSTCFRELHVVALINRVCGLISSLEVSNMVTPVSRTISGMHHENDLMPFRYSIPAMEVRSRDHTSQVTARLQGH